MMYTNDKDWLDRMKLAAEHFERSNEATKEAVDSFIRWTYALYGVVLPEDRKGDKK